MCNSQPVMRKEVYKDNPVELQKSPGLDVKWVYCLLHSNNVVPGAIILESQTTQEQYAFNKAFFQL